jgi:EAL domain-containing protein (putative c-di-GMP-specific phosphodiesterase class I)
MRRRSLDASDSSGRTGVLGLGKEWPWLLGTALFVGIALSIGAFALGSGTTSVTMLSVALISLCLAQVVMMLRNHFHSLDLREATEAQAELSETVAKLKNDGRRSHADYDALSHSLHQFRNEALSLNHGVVEGLNAMRHSHESLAENIRSMMENQNTIHQSQQAMARVEEPILTIMQQGLEREQQWTAQVQAETAPPPEVQAEEQEVPFGEALNLALEPIVDLFTSNTAHYRMVLGMINDQGNDVPHDVFVHHAERMGLRDRLDVHVVEQTLNLLTTLRQRDPNLSIFVPIGATTLSNPQALQNIAALLYAQPENVSGVVVDVPHAVLASLPDASLEGLATLARAGVTLSLSQASIAGVDLSALHRLNVRYVSLAASSIGIGGQISAGLPGFVQSARAMRVHIIVSHVGDPRQVENLARTARYASGPAFAPPRKLKRAQPTAAQQSAAA